MTAAEEFRKQAVIAQAKAARAAAVLKEARAEFAVAILGMYENDMGVSQIRREFDLSETQVRNTIRLERLRQAGGS